jgi:hypothetical protein
MTLNHAADVILHITTSQAVANKIYAKANTASGIAETSIGAVHSLWAEKNKHAVPFIKVKFPVIYGQEISNLEYLKRLIEDKKLYTKSGMSWYTNIGGIECKLNGKEAVAQFIEDHFEELREKLFAEGHYDLISFEGVSEEERNKATDED